MTNSDGSGIKTVKADSGKITFSHEAPGFSIQYPEDWVQLQVPPHIGNAVFYASQLMMRDITIRVVDKNDPSIPPDYSLENAISYFSRMLRIYGTDINVLSDQQTKLKDGTPAAEGVMEYRRVGTNKVTILTLTTDHADKWISISIGAISDLYKKNSRISCIR